jgi:hypothetical protein
LLGSIVGTLKEYVELKPCEYITVAAWILHSHCFRNFMITPRLVLRSPTPGCGKTALMDLLQRLTARGVTLGGRWASFPSTSITKGLSAVPVARVEHGVHLLPGFAALKENMRLVRGDMLRGAFGEVPLGLRSQTTLNNVRPGVDEVVSG